MNSISIYYWKSNFYIVDVERLDKKIIIFILFQIFAREVVIYNIKEIQFNINNFFNIYILYINYFFILK